MHNTRPDGMAGTDEPSGVDQVFLSLERELAVFLRRARATSGELARAVHPELESAAYGLLVRLADAGQQRATDLAGYFGVGKATMSRQLRALEDLGLIAREPDPADGRAVLVRLTDEGHDRFSCVRNSRRAQYARQLASWDRREVAELARLLHRLNGEQDAEEGCGAAPAAGKSDRAGKGERGGDGRQDGDGGSAGNG